ncbi:hypothetical protein Tco_1332038 [Tanacetum coccineum]
MRMSVSTHEAILEELKVIKFNVSTDFEDDYYNLEGNIIYLKSLLIKDIIPNLTPEVFLDHDPRSLEDEPDKDDLKNIVKVFDPGIWEKLFSPTYVKLPFEDRHYLSLTYVIQIFLPYFTYLVDSSLPLSSGSEDIIFDPDIPVFSFYSLEPVVTDIPQKDKNKAKRTKPSTGLEEYEKSKPKAYTSLNGPTPMLAIPNILIGGKDMEKYQRLRLD